MSRLRITFTTAALLLALAALTLNSLAQPPAGGGGRGGRGGGPGGGFGGPGGGFGGPGGGSLLQLATNTAVQITTGSEAYGGVMMWEYTQPTESTLWPAIQGAL